MSVFESNVRVNRPVSEVYDFLADLNNHQRLIGDNVQDWSSTQETMTFSVQNMLKLSLKSGDLITNKEIRIIPADKPPFEMELLWQLIPVGEVTDVSFTITADLNMMLKLVASGPLKKIAEQETQILASILT